MSDFLSQYRYIDLKLDIAFKAMFGDINHKHILAHFLNCVLPEGIHVADILSIENSSIGGERVDERGVEYDVFCVDNEGKKFIVEMQNQNQQSFLERMLFYVSKAIVNQAKKGVDWNFEVMPVHFVGILNFALDNEALSGEVVQHLQIKNQENKVVTKTVSYTLIQLPLFLKNDEQQIENELEWWLFTFANLDKLKQVPEKLKSSIFEEVFELNQHFAMNPATRQAWEETVKRQRDLSNQIYTAKLEGKLEGKLESKVEIAREFKKLGIASSVIAIATGLSEAEIAKL